MSCYTLNMKNILHLNFRAIKNLNIPLKRALTIRLCTEANKH